MGYFKEMTSASPAVQGTGERGRHVHPPRLHGPPAWWTSNGIYDGVVFKGYKDPTLNDIYLITNNTWNWFVYTAFELTVSKRAKNFQ